MDHPRDPFLDTAPQVHEEDDELVAEFPVIIAQGERRMQVRAYCHWTNLLGPRQLPLVADLRLDELGDIADHAVMLDFAASEDDPRITYVGATLALECDTPRHISHIDDVPKGTVLSRIIAQYPQIHANQAPIGFEEEFVNQRGATLAYRGMLLPFAEEDGGPIRYVLGVINWKEMASPELTKELTRQITDALSGLDLSGAGLAPMAGGWIEWAEAPAQDTAPDEPVSPHQQAIAALSALEYAPVPEELAQYMDLADWLVSARELARRAGQSGEGSRAALYGAIGRMYDFELASREEPRELAKMLAQAGLVPQARAPLVPLVKLVFGADYDKTRLTEYATVLAHARRLGLGRGELARHLARVVGGLKGIVTEERRLRQAESPRRRREDAYLNKLDAMVPQSFASLAPTGAEFTLLVARRMPDGSVMLLGEAGDEPALLARAAGLI